MTSWISDLSNQVTASISQIEKTLDTAVHVTSDPALGATSGSDAPDSQKSWEERALAAELRADGLLKEGLVLAEKQGAVYPMFLLHVQALTTST